MQAIIPCRKYVTAKQKVKQCVSSKVICTKDSECEAKKYKNVMLDKSPVCNMLNEKENVY